MTTIADDNTPNKLLVEQSSTPSTPAAGKQRLFIRTSDHKLCRVDSGGTVTVIESSGGVASGTSFPGSPSTNDLYFRTDRGLMYFYDGTRWLTTQIYYIQGSVSNAPYSTNADHANGIVDATYDMYLLNYEATTYVGTTNNGSNYWTCTLKWVTAADAQISTATFNTSADTVGNWTRHSTAINAVMSNTARAFYFSHAKTGTPGNLFVVDRIAYRLVG